MKRDIKFKIIDKERQNTAYVDLLDICNFEDTEDGISIFDAIVDETSDRDRFEILEYTGFNAAGHMEIYEGDILKRTSDLFDNEIGNVAYVNGIPHLITRYNSIPFNCLNLSEWENIGTIYSDKEVKE